MKNRDVVIERMAKAGYGVYFDEDWDELAKNSIELTMWKNVANKMLDELARCWQEAKMKPKKVREIKGFPKPKSIPEWRKLPSLTNYQRGLRQGIFDGIMDYNELLKQVGELDLPKLSRDKIYKLTNDCGITEALCWEGADIWENDE